MKEKYIKPEIEFVGFDCEDVITTSSNGPIELPIIPVNYDE